MKVDGIHLSIPTNAHERSWFDSLGWEHWILVPETPSLS